MVDQSFALGASIAYTIRLLTLRILKWPLYSSTHAHHIHRTPNHTPNNNYRWRSVLISGLLVQVFLGECYEG